MSKSPGMKLEEWVKQALSTLPRGDGMAVELATTSDETQSISRIIIDASATGYADGSIPSDGDRTGTVAVVFNTSADRVSAASHDATASAILELLGDRDTMMDAATEIADFYLYTNPAVDFTPSAIGGTEDGTRIRQSTFTLVNVLFRDDDGTGT